MSVTLDFNEEAAENMDLLKERLGVETRTELVRRALVLLDYTEEKKQEGYRLFLKRGDSVIGIKDIS